MKPSVKISLDHYNNLVNENNNFKNRNKELNQQIEGLKNLAKEQMHEIIKAEFFAKLPLFNKIIKQVKTDTDEYTITHTAKGATVKAIYNFKEERFIKLETQVMIYGELIDIDVHLKVNDSIVYNQINT